VSTADDRDPHVEDDRLLKRALTPGDAAPAGPCLDAETLAAWADGATRVSDADAIEQHLASCARCQAMLAAFANAEAADATYAAAVTSSPADRPSNVVPFRSTLTRWVPIALGAIAASLVIYAAWPPHRTTAPDRADQKIASAAPIPQTPPAPDSRGFGTAAAAPPVKTDAAQAERKPSNAGATKLPRQAVPSEPAAPPPATRPLPAPPMPVIATGASAANATIDGVRLATPPPPTATPAAAAAKPAELLMLRSAADAANDPASTRVVADFSSPATTAPPVGQSMMGQGGAGGAGRGGGGGRLLASTPRPVARVNWRVLAAGQVERSVNGGQTWAPVTITPTAPIISGVAPSASVCWLIGRTGIVLLSTDGATFRRVHSPDVADLRSIIAIDEFQAKVTTIDGRVFTTEDGGETWKQ
jgi:hypothetical protein